MTRLNILGVAILLLVSCTLMDKIPLRWEVLYLGALGRSGGLVGWFLADLSGKYLGTIGSYIVAAMFLLLSILLTTNFSLRAVGAKIKISEKKKKETEPVPTVEPHVDVVPLSNNAELQISVAKKPSKPTQPEFEFMDELYEPPSTDLLAEPDKQGEISEEELREDARILEETLLNFGVSVKIAHVYRGPVITRFEVRPSPGVKVSSIINLSNDLALGLAVPSVRIEAPVPGKAVLGIEIPNKNPDIVRLRELIESKEYQQAKFPLSFCLGKNIAGESLVADLEGMPHLLIAGATGSGKSVFIYSLIASLLFRNGPADLRFVLIDPKMVELSVFAKIPHLILPVVKDVKEEAGSAMKWLVREMEDRYDAFVEKGVHTIRDYNKTKPRLPYLVIIIDELADLMLVSPLEIEDRLCRIAQMGRAVGMHLVLATQRPSVDIITGVIKANFPSRISFAVSTNVDSRTILDFTGAEKLLGKGDMLFSQIGTLKPVRIQGALVSREEVKKVASYLEQKYGSPSYAAEKLQEMKEEEKAGKEEDELFKDALKVVIRNRQASTSLLQRRLKIGYNRAARIIDTMYEKGLVGPSDGSKPRDVLVDEGYLRKIEGT